MLNARLSRLRANLIKRMWTLASSTEILTDAFTDVGTIFVLVLGTLVSLVIALMGLGYGIRALKKHATGKKF